MNPSDNTVPVASLVLILGLGVTGIAAARWCAQAGARLRLADTRAEPPALAGVTLPPEAELHLGVATFAPELLEGVEQVVVSPGLAPDGAALACLAAAARERGIALVGEIELFAQALCTLASTRSYTPAVLAITGTNGKTTVTALTAALVNAAGRKAVAAGNIGPAALDALVAALAADALPDVWVMELSSFQLETLHTLRADAAVVLNLSEDHLDWHGGMKAYAAAKARIFSGSRILIVNRGDARVLAMVPAADAIEVRTFGADAPMLAGDLGLESSHGMGWLAVADFDEFGSEPAPRRKKKTEAPPIRPEGRIERLMPVDALQIRGLHNALNAQAALLLARSLDLPWAPLLRALSEYRGEPHRVAWVRSIAGVDFIDDSKGTNVGATLAALQGLGRRVVLIAGGDGKGQDFLPLCAAVAQHARGVVLIGSDARRIADALAGSGVEVTLASDLPAAVAQAMALAQEGDTVLLSPACASLDMFRDYRHRAEVFVQAVQELALDRGEV